jgi:hypothetical protein
MVTLRKIVISGVPSGEKYLEINIPLGGSGNKYMITRQ